MLFPFLLGLYPVSQHFLVYVPIDKARIVIVALMRQVRDVPAILQANSFQIQRALNEAVKEFAGKRQEYIDSGALLAATGIPCRY